MKPTGLAMTIQGHSLSMHVTQPNRVTDAIWEAVQEAVSAGTTVERFRREAAEAWDYEMKQRAKDAAAAWCR